MILNIILSSKKKNAIKLFILFLKTINQSSSKIKLDFKIITSSKKHYKYTLLKSPHIYKTAREQFVIVCSFHKLNAYKLIQFENILLLFKIIQNNTITEINFKYSFKIPNFYKLISIQQKQILRDLNLKNYIILSEIDLCKYLKIFEILGKIMYSYVK